MADTLEILFEDNHCLAVVKPAGLLTQAPAHVPSLETLVKAYLKEKYHKPGNVYLGVPHRLDRPVSGVVLFARNSKAADRLSEQFREHKVTKIYWGIVEGTPDPSEGEWEDWMRKVENEARAEKTGRGEPDAKLAVMHYRVMQTLTADPSPMGRGEEHALVEFEPRTGRMHQIRLQAALRGHPLSGDELYGSTRPFGPAAELQRDRIIALHGRSLTVLHPLSYEPLTLTAPLPASWRELGIKDVA